MKAIDYSYYWYIIYCDNNSKKEEEEEKADSGPMQWTKCLILYYLSIYLILLFLTHFIPKRTDRNQVGMHKTQKVTNYT